jgi:hypothetical protein
MWRECRRLKAMGGRRVRKHRPTIRWLARHMCVALALGALDGAALLPAQSIMLTPVSPVDSFATATVRGRFWFIARVIRRDTVTTKLINRTRHTTAVEVDSVIAAPSAIRPFAGRTITTIVGDTTGVESGARFLFIASGVVVDTSLVLRERGRVALEAGSDLALVTPKLFAADTVNLERAIRRRADSSAMIAVVRATAILVPPIGGQGGGGGERGRGGGRGGGGRAGGGGAGAVLRSEDDPRWRLAVVSIVDSIAGAANPVRGTTDAAPIPYSVYFPGSRSWKYARAPRLAQDTVVVVLGRRIGSLPPELRQGLDTTRAFVVWDSLDVRPARDSSLVRRALQ